MVLAGVEIYYCSSIFAMKYTVADSGFLFLFFSFFHWDTGTHFSHTLEQIGHTSTILGYFTAPFLYIWIRPNYKSIFLNKTKETSMDVVM